MVESVVQYRFSNILMCELITSCVFSLAVSVFIN